MKKLIKDWRFWGIIASIYVIIDITIERGIIGSILFFIKFIISAYIGYIILKKLWNRWNNKQRLKFIKLLQIVGFSTLMLLLILPNSITDMIIFGISLHKILIHIAIFPICISISLRMWWFTPRKSKLDTLEQQIKKDLKITSTTKIVKFPKCLRWIGGFVMPAIPFFLVLNKKWRKKLTREALIHEHVHLYYIQNGAVLVLIVGLALLWSIVDSALTFMKNYFSYIIPIYLLFMVVFFEYITFNKTNQYSKKIGFKTRKWNSEICLKYIIVYGIFISIVSAIYFSIKYLFLKLIGL